MVPTAWLMKTCFSVPATVTGSRLFSQSGGSRVALCWRMKQEETGQAITTPLLLCTDVMVNRTAGALEYDWSS